MNQEQIGKFMRENRERKHLTQEQLAEQLGLTSKSISRWEHGKTMPDISMLKPLSEILDVSVQELLNGRKMTKEELLEWRETIENLIEYESTRQIKKETKTNRYIIAGNIILVFALFSSAFELFDPILPKNAIEFLYGFLFGFGVTLNLAGIYNNSHDISICERKKQLLRKMKRKVKLNCTP